MTIKRKQVHRTKKKNNTQRKCAQVETYKLKKNLHSFIHSFIFVAAFPHGRVVEAGKPVDSKCLVFSKLRYSATDYTKQGWGFNHATWSLVDFPVGATSRTCLNHYSWDIPITSKIIVAAFSPFGDVARLSAIYEFHSCALCCVASHGTATSSQKSHRCHCMVLDTAHFQLLTKINDHKRGSNQRPI